jgi:hypothetical protein
MPRALAHAAAKRDLVAVLGLPCACSLVVISGPGEESPSVVVTPKAVSWDIFGTPGYETAGAQALPLSLIGVC